MQTPQRLFPCTFAVFIVALGLITSSNCYAEKHEHINLAGGKGLPFSDGVIAGKTL